MQVRSDRCEHRDLRDVSFCGMAKRFRRGGAKGVMTIILTRGIQIRKKKLTVKTHFRTLHSTFSMCIRPKYNEFCNYINRTTITMK